MNRALLFAPVLLVLLLHTTLLVRRARAYLRTAPHLREPRVLYSDVFIYFFWLVTMGIIVISVLRPTP